MKYIKNVPVVACGLSLSLAALGNLLLPYGDAIRYICGFLSIAIFLVLILKLFLAYEQIKEELKNPIVLSIMPTSTMALMLLCTYIKPFAGSAAVFLWYAVVITHFCLMCFLIKRFICNFTIQAAFPSWFAVFVGVVAVSISGAVMEARLIGRAAFYIGFIHYFLILPLVIYRVVKVKLMPEPARPTIAIFNAPMSLCITGYFSSFEQQNAVLVYFMLSIAVITYVYVSINMVFLLRLQFYPSYAAFTFPYVISAIAFKTANVFLAENGINFFNFIPPISELAAIAVVVYVLIRYLIFIIRPESEKRAVVC